MRKLLPAVLLCASSAFAQQEPQFTQFWNALSYFNPATGAREYDHEAYAVVRDQWTNVYGNPSTQLLSYSSKLRGINSSVGGSYMHENIGFSNFHKVKATYAYQLQLGRYTSLSFGLAAGFQYMKNSTVFFPGPFVDSTFWAPSTRFTADFGVALRWRKLDLGLSVTQLPQSKYANGYRDALHLFGFAGYDIQISAKGRYKPAFIVRPQVFLKTDFNFYSLDFNLLFKYNYLYAGVTLRSNDCIGLMAGWDIKGKFRVSYAYEMSFSKLNNGIFGSTHEIGLGFMFKKRVKSSPYIKSSDAF
jgi:type IX secretion system PorP/SprF family membrane protein